MKLAIPVNKNNHVDGHFGHCEAYKVVTINENNEIIDSEIVESPKGCGCKSDIAHTLADNGVSVMLAGGIGAGAVNKLNGAGIEVIRGCSGDVEELVKKYVVGEINDNGSNCNHHDHHHSHGHDHHHSSCNHH